MPFEYSEGKSLPMFKNKYLNFRRTTTMANSSNTVEVESSTITLNMHVHEPIDISKEREISEWITFFRNLNKGTDDYDKDLYCFVFRAVARNGGFIEETTSKDDGIIAFKFSFKSAENIISFCTALQKRIACFEDSDLDD